MKIGKIATLLISLFVMAGCVATGPADDGFELSQESTNIGKLLGDDLLRLRIDRPLDKVNEKYDEAAGHNDD